MFFDPKQLVLIATDRRCPDCKKISWSWIKDEEEEMNGRCSCGSLYKQREIKVHNDWNGEFDKEDGIDFIPYI